MFDSLKIEYTDNPATIQRIKDLIDGSPRGATILASLRGPVVLESETVHLEGEPAFKFLNALRRMDIIYNNTNQYTPGNLHIQLGQFNSKAHWKNPFDLAPKTDIGSGCWGKDSLVEALEHFYLQQVQHGYIVKDAIELPISEHSIGILIQEKREMDSFCNALADFMTEVDSPFNNSHTADEYLVKNRQELNAYLQSPDIQPIVKTVLRVEEETKKREQQQQEKLEMEYAVLRGLQLKLVRTDALNPIVVKEPTIFQGADALHTLYALAQKDLEVYRSFSSHPEHFLNGKQREEEYMMYLSCVQRFRENELKSTYTRIEMGAPILIAIGSGNLWERWNKDLFTIKDMAKNGGVRITQKTEAETAGMLASIHENARYCEFESLTAPRVYKLESRLPEEFEKAFRSIGLSEPWAVFQSQLASYQNRDLEAICRKTIMELANRGYPFDAAKSAFSNRKDIAMKFRSKLLGALRAKSLQAFFKDVEKRTGAKRNTGVSR